MSWGERSCAQGRPCGYNPTPLTCNVSCPGYRWDGYTKPDSGELPVLTKTHIYDDFLNVAHMVLTTATVYTPPELVKAAEAALRKAGEIPGDVKE